jgi:putative membrane protein
MAAHILAMNVAAPVLGAILLARWKTPVRGVSLLWFATFAQIVLLWIWHAPVVQNLNAHFPGALIASYTCLLLAATTFWMSLFSLSGHFGWQVIPALLVTGKLICLLAALLVFAPRALYVSTAHPAHGLDDQHLAGLLMLAACPLGYVVAAVIMTVRLVGVDKQPGAELPIQRTVS